MLLLTATTDKISVITSSAAALDVHASWVDAAASGLTAPVGGRTNTAISSATTTDVVGVPGASTTRNVKTLHIRNKDAALADTVTVQFNQNGTLFELHKVTLQIGDCLEYIEGVGFFQIVATVLPLIGRVLTADDTGGQNVLTAQPWFPTNGSLAVSATTTYRMWGQLIATRAAGANSHTTGLLFGGTATITSIEYEATWRTGDANAAAATNSLRVAVATNTTVKAASTSTTEDIDIGIVGTVRINGAGTLIPQFIYSAAPGGTPTIKANTYFWLQPIGDNATDKIGTWT